MPILRPSGNRDSEWQMKLRERRWTLHRWHAPVLGVGLGACAGAAPSADGPATVEARGDSEHPGCVVARVPLAVGDGVYPYIEPEDLIQVGSSYVVVGSPSYTWAPGTPGDSLPLTMNRHLAARFTLDGRATLIERPVQDSVGSVRALPLGGDRWGVLFDIERRRASGHNWESVALWYAEHDGAAWSLLEPVPMPEEWDLDIDSSSELVRVGEDLVWVVAVRPSGRPPEVVEYTRREGEWEHRVVSDHWMEVSTLAYEEGSGLWMANFAVDPRATDRQRALRLYRRTADWQLMRHVYVASGGESAGDPSITVRPGGVTVTWRVISVADHGAYALVGIGPDSEGTPVDLDREVPQVLSLRSPDGAPRWLLTHVNEDRSVDLRLLGPRALFGAERMAAAPSPYLGFLAALARTPQEAIVVGPEVSSDPADPFVRSLILRLSTSCT
ncbi:MAG TPA: hypothetical protein VMM35_12135 [Longimicrobiales bacterium]|nr:hypothetical protein [Longimicrobiales bacterium]